MEDKVKTGRTHGLSMQDRKKAEMTGITDVISFDPLKVVLESDYGLITIKGQQLHVNRLSVEKGEISVDGKIDSFVYSENGSYSKKGESLVGRLFR